MTLLAAVLVFACRSSDNNTTTDSSTKTYMDAPGSGSGSGSADVCTTYTTGDTIAMMRQAKSGCYELDNVVSIALDSSTTNPHLYVEDAAGGAYSAIMGMCESHSTTHPCTVASTVAGIATAHKVTMKGTYIKTSSSTFEEFYIDSVTDNGATTAIAPATAALADVERGGSNVGLRFQYVSVTLPNPLNMYDYTPAEFTYSGSNASCPYVTGFGLIATTEASKPTGCANYGSAATQPTGVATPDAAEVLIATDFYKQFPAETDCRCGSATDVPANSDMVTALKGMLMFETTESTNEPYYYLDPTTATDVTWSSPI